VSHIAAKGAAPSHIAPSPARLFPIRDTRGVIDLTTEQTEAVLANGRLGHVACWSENEVYVTPMSYVFLDNVFYFRTGEGRRTDALRQDPKVCVEVTRLKEGDAWESALFWGEARFVDDVDERARVVQALLAKYHQEAPLGSPSAGSPLDEPPPIVAIEPQRLTGRASGGGLGPKTRPGRL